MLTYCNRCVMPSTRPDVTLVDGTCSACRSYDDRSNIDWPERKRQFLDIMSKYRSKNKQNWDCIIPVSGGKDSTYQVIKILQLGLKPLCVCATTCYLSEIGRRNLDNLKNLGADVIELSPNPKIRHKLNRIGLSTVGDISWPEHVSMFTIPTQIAVTFNVPLIVWGENSQNEFGGPATEAEENYLDKKWLEEFGGMLGLRVSDLVANEGIDEQDLLFYTYPDDEEIKKVGVTGIFLGHFFPWDGLNNATLVSAYGFENYSKVVEGTIFTFENLDNNFHGVHDYFKFLKFGFGRATDHACLQIRRNRIDRHTALELVKQHEGKFPSTYLGKSLDDMLMKIRISKEEFINLCDDFTNRDLFKLDRNGALVKDSYGNLVKINYDNI